jgi:hypothetical protein
MLSITLYVNDAAAGYAPVLNTQMQQYNVDAVQDNRLIRIRVLNVDSIEVSSYLVTYRTLVFIYHE